MTTAVQLLADAKAALERYGWIKGDAGTCATGFCAVGALSYAAAGTDVPFGAWRTARDVLASTVPAWDVVGFNDDPGTTKDDVLALFDRAIERVSA